MDASAADALRWLLHRQPVAALATLHHGQPALSMVPYAMLPGRAALVIHVSRLAPHTRDLEQHPIVALLVTDALAAADTPLALPRVSLEGEAQPCPPEHVEYALARSAYLDKLPDSAPLFDFADFSLVRIELRALRYVAGFGRAHALAGDALDRCLAQPPAPPGS